MASPIDRMNAALEAAIEDANPGSLQLLDELMDADTSLTADATDMAIGPLVIRRIKIERRAQQERWSKEHDAEHSWEEWTQLLILQIQQCQIGNRNHYRQAGDPSHHPDSLEILRRGCMASIAALAAAAMQASYDQIGGSNLTESLDG